MRKLFVLPLAGLAVATACTDPPMMPLEPSALTAASAPLLSLGGSAGEASLDFSTDLNDLKNRVLPGFKDEDAAKQLAGYLDELHEHLMAGEAEEASRVLAAAREVAHPDVTNWGDWGNINLVLNTIGRALGEP